MMLRHRKQQKSAKFEANHKDMQCRMEEMIFQIKLLQRAISNDQTMAIRVRPRVKVPEPQSYNGIRDAKTVENFLFDMEQYLDNSGIEDDTKRVALAMMYLVWDAKLWWRIKYDKIKEGWLQLETWDVLKILRVSCPQGIAGVEAHEEHKGLRENILDSDAKYQGHVIKRKAIYIPERSRTLN